MDKVFSLSAAQDWEEKDGHPRSARGATQSQMCRRQPGLLLPPALHQGEPQAGAHRVPRQRSSQPAVWHQEDSEEAKGHREQQTESSGKEETPNVNILQS